MNLAEYEGNNPVKYVDPYGFAKCRTNNTCCSKWEPGWKVGGYADKISCFSAVYAQIASTTTFKMVASTTGGTLIGVGKIFGKVSGWPALILGAGISAIALNEIKMAYDICNDLYCTRTRKADSVYTPGAGNLACDQTRCSCLNPDGSESSFSSVGDRKSP